MNLLAVDKAERVILQVSLMLLTDFRKIDKEELTFEPLFSMVKPKWHETRIFLVRRRWLKWQSL